MRILWDEVKAEAVQYLQEYLQINTVNPPGHEKPAAEFLCKILEAEGLEVETYAADPERPNLICRLEGDGSKPGLILLHHMDVVPVEPENWSVNPFGGEIRDGFLWGRGALDMKSLGIMEMMAFLLAHRRSLPLQRDLIYIAVADEETGGRFGAAWLAENQADKCRAEYLLNEGGSGWTAGGLSGFFCGVGEKGPLWLRLWAEGPPGHGSIPLHDNACVRLVKALDRIAEHKQPLQIVSEMRAFLQKAGIGRDATPEELAKHSMMTLGPIAAMFHNTISLTGLKAGQKENVIPSKAEATLDCRLLPGVDQASFITELKRIIGDEKIQMEVIEGFEASSSPPDTEMYQAIELALAENYPGITVLPTISTGFTDSRCFRKLGCHCYGLSPILVDREILSTAHGHDERIPLDGLDKGIKVIFVMIQKLNSD